MRDREGVHDGVEKSRVAGFSDFGSATLGGSLSGETAFPRARKTRVATSLPLVTGKETEVRTLDNPSQMRPAS